MRERRDEQVIGFRAEIVRQDRIEAHARLRDGGPAVGRAAEVGPLILHQPGAGLRWMHRAEPAVATKCQLPPVRTCRVGAEQRAVVLSAAEILRAVGKRRAVIELRHAIAAVERAPRDPDSRAAARCERAVGRDRARVAGAEHAAVVADQGDLIAVAVVIRVEGDRVLIGVRVPRTRRRAVAEARQPPIPSAIVRSEPLDAGRPHAIRIARIDGDDVVVPAHRDE